MTLTELLCAVVILSMTSLLSVNVALPRFSMGKLSHELLSCQLQAMQEQQDCTVTVTTQQGYLLQERYNSRGRVNHPCTLEDEGQVLVIELAGGRIIEK